MSVYLDTNTNTYYTTFRYKDLLGNSKTTTKRSFKSKKEALKYELTFEDNLDNKLSASFKDLAKTYLDYSSNHLKPSSYKKKELIFNTKILPYFKSKDVYTITPKDILKWHNYLLNLNSHTLGKENTKLDPNYLNQCHEQLSAFFNFLVKFYHLDNNPCRSAGNVSKKVKKEMSFYSLEEFNRLIAVVDKQEYQVLFKLLYYTGIRLGESLALNIEDINFIDKTLSINKSYSDFTKDISTTKTNKSIRTIKLPDNLLEDLKRYISNNTITNSLFNLSERQIRYALKKYSNKAKLKQIRIHDLRHSHVSLLIHMGYSPVDIASRVGHESIKITMNYAHMFKDTDNTIANKLDSLISTCK